MTDYILIVDFGSQLTQLIARRVRDSGVYSEIHPFHALEAGIDRMRRPKGVILSGGPESIAGSDAPVVPQWLFEMGTPVLGICYGQQAMMAQLGGEVEASECREFGRAYVEITSACALFEGVWKAGERQQVWMSHGDQVSALARGFKVVASSVNAPCAVVADDNRKFYGVQFHPEVAHTPDGARLLKAFAYGVCGCSGGWSMSSFRHRAIEEIRTRAGSGRVICALSGGVDSSVTAALVHEAVGEKITCIFVDHGLGRQDEAELALDVFKNRLHINLVHVDASDIFLERLAGKVDPEDKRAVIGEAFIDVFEREAAAIGGVEFLAQGTVYPDVIESAGRAGSPSAMIKSHHNVGGLPERMRLRLIEPLRELFKDEVRKLGRELGLPQEIIGRHPFPGPGLAIRLPGQAVTREKLDILRKADAIYLSEIRDAGLYDVIWQAFAVLLPVLTVGVMGDARTYEHAVTLRAVVSTDGMTADYYHYDYDFLSRVATRIINEVRGINRVVYDVTSKPPGTIEWE